MADGSGPILVAPNTVVGFAGFGGLCDALKTVTGQEPGLAMNHWDIAVHVHQKLFPNTFHHLGDIYELKPLTWKPGEPIRFAWFSPDCTDHSKAKGGVPKTERIRGLAWSATPWAKLRQVQTIMLENVEEWWDWGPIYRCPDDWRAQGVRGEVGHPIKALRGVTRKAWVRRMNQSGYWVEKRELVTANFGVPTTRKRLYVICEYVGQERLTRIALGLEPSPIHWAAPTHASRKTAAKKGLAPWIGFDTCAEWDEPCPSIFLTPEEVKDLRATTGRSVKRPLVAATLKRVARGLDRYVISSADPFIVPITHQGDSRAHDVRDPLRTVTSVKGGEFALVAPTLASLAHGEFDERAGARVRDLTDPLNTISAGGGDAALVTGFLAPRYGERVGQAPRAIDVTEPHPTVVPTGNGGGLVAASLLRTNFHSAAARNGIRDVEEPIATVTGDGGMGIAAVHLTKINFGEKPCQGADEPLHTITAQGNKFGVVSATVVGVGGRRGQSPPLDIQEPMATITGKPDAGLVSAHLVRQFGTSVGGRDIEEPVGTIMPGDGKGGGGKTQLVTAYMAQGNRGMDGREAAEPVTTLTQRSTQQQLVAAHLGSYYGTQNGFQPEEPMNTATGHARHAMTMAWLEQANTGMVGHEMGEPISTIVGGSAGNGWGTTQRLIQARLELDGGPIGRRDKVLAFLWSHFGVPTPAEWEAPTATLEARRKFGLVILQGQVWMIVDIGLRMLLAKELARATGLSDDHDMSTDCFGRPVSKTHQTMGIGNMVPREPAASLIRTQCPDMVKPSEERKAA